jgi:EAL domain-containing protein (putative c-di-GMP-specific phosphodiesterase class I)
MELDLRQSFSVGGLELHFQPRIELASGRMSGVEALVRWDHPQRGPVPPSEFVVLAEERLALAVKRPESFVIVDFDMAPA